MVLTHCLELQRAGKQRRSKSTKLLDSRKQSYKKTVVAKADIEVDLTELWHKSPDSNIW